MKDLFETLISIEAQHTRRSARRKPQSLAGDSLRDLMGGSATERDMSFDLESEMSRGGKSILEDFDYDRDFEEASLETEGEELNFEE